MSRHSVTWNLIPRHEHEKLMAENERLAAQLEEAERRLAIQSYETEPVSSLKEVMEYLNSDEGMPEGLVHLRVPLSEVKELDEADRLALRSCLDELRAV